MNYVNKQLEAELKSPIRIQIEIETKIKNVKIKRKRYTALFFI